MLVEEGNYANDIKHSIICTIEDYSENFRSDLELQEIDFGSVYRSSCSRQLRVKWREVTYFDEEEERRLVQVPFDASQLKSPISLSLGRRRVSVRSGIQIEQVMARDAQS